MLEKNLKIIRDFSPDNALPNYFYSIQTASIAPSMCSLTFLVLTIYIHMSLLLGRGGGGREREKDRKRAGKVCTVCTMYSCSMLMYVTFVEILFPNTLALSCAMARIILYS
jgi:hypothetical protein